MKKRKQYTGEEKIAILRKHLLEGVSVADVCDEYGLQPTVFYRWQKQLFEQGAVAFRRLNDVETRKLRRQVERLEEKLGKKDEVLGELMEEYVALKVGAEKRHRRRADARMAGGQGKQVL